MPLPLSPAAIVSPGLHAPHSRNLDTHLRQLLSRTSICFRPSAWPCNQRSQPSSPPHHLLLCHSSCLRHAVLRAKRAIIMSNLIHLALHAKKDRTFGTIGYVGCFSPDAPVISKRNTRDARHWTARGPHGPSSRYCHVWSPSNA